MAKQAIPSPLGDAASRTSGAELELREAHRILGPAAVDTLAIGFTRDGVSMADKSMTGTFQLNLPRDLLSEAMRQSKPKQDQLRVEGWRDSWLSRISEMLVGRD